MSPPRKVLAALLAVAALAGVAGCGEDEKEGTAGEQASKSAGEAYREGLAIELGGLEYNVFITRQLNLALPEDRAYYDGPPAPAGSADYGVFIQVCNREDGGEARQSAEEFEITDTQGGKFKPVELPERNQFAYRPASLQAQQCIPARGSVAQLGPTAGLMLLFQLPQSATENRPLELEITDRAGESIVFQLDI